MRIIDRFGMVVTVLVAATGAATGALAQAPAVSAPAFEETPCPAEMTAGIPNEMRCGFLTVPEDRSDPDGQSIRVFVTRIQPPGHAPLPDPVFNVFVGAQPGYSGIAPLAERVNREVILISARGMGWSEPELTCPEVQRVTQPALGVALGSPAMDAAFMDGVGACHDRLVADGVDLAAYNLAEIAADAEDLRIALGVEEWSLATGGDSSMAAYEILRRYPEHIHAAWIDSPVPPQLDRWTLAITATQHALGQVAAACAEVRPCAMAYPEIDRDWEAALRGLDRDPSRILDEGLTVEVDDATAVRYLRKGFFEPGRVPLAIRDLALHGWRNEDPAGANANWSGDAPYAAGLARLSGQLSHGLLYSTLCHDELPYVDRAALEAAANGRPWYVDAYVASPWQALCERWNVGRADASPYRPLVSTIPTLTLVGRFDPLSPLPLVREATRSLTTSHVIEFPTLSHNVLGDDCPVAIRNAWIRDLSSPPDTSCIADMAPIEFALPPPEAGITGEEKPS